MNINRDNCEAYFLDFYEGRLTPAQAEQLFAFLDEHSDLKEIFESYESMTLDPFIDSIDFPSKEELKRFADLPRTINEANAEEFFIASAEGLLDAHRTKELDAFLAAHPERRAEFELYAKTRLQPEPVIFENKASLKKTALIEKLITVDNHEEYFIAAVEGLLNAAEMQALEAFLAAHPQYQSEYDLFAQTKLQPEAIVFEDKASLRKSIATITAENAEEKMIASIEGLLSAEEQNALDRFLASSPAHAAEFVLYQKTILTAENVVFEDKDSLRREKDRVVIFWWRYAAAAAVLLLIGLLWINRSAITGEQEKGNPMASNDTTLHPGKTPSPVPSPAPKKDSSAPQLAHDQPGAVKAPKENNGVVPQPDNDRQIAVTAPRVVESLHGGVAQQLNESNPDQMMAGNFHTVDPLIDQLSFVDENNSNNNQYLTPGQMASRFLKKKLLPQDENDLPVTDASAVAHPKEQDHITRWDLANMTVNGVNKMTGWGIRIKRRQNDVGTTYTLMTNKHTWSHTFKH